MPLPALILGIALVWTLLAPQRSAWLTMWLVAQLFYIPAVWGVWLGTHGEGSMYLEIYFVFTAAILVTVLGLALSALGEPRRSILMAAAGVSCCIGFALVMGAPSLTAADIVQIAESVTLTFAALVLGLSVHGRNQVVAGTLSLLWLCQAGVRAGAVLHETNWLTVTEWLPATLLIAAVTWIGFILRWEARQEWSAT